jgi:hypothetical protein
MALLSIQSCRSERTIVTLKKAAQQGLTAPEDTTNTMAAR